MLDLEKAFKDDNYQTFLRAEYEMPKELLDDSYQLFWEAIKNKKYQVASFLMRKPYFKPFLASKPEKWVNILFNIPSLFYIACEHHIEKSRITDNDAIILVKSALRLKSNNFKGIKNLTENFTYEELSQTAKYQASDLLGRLLMHGQWYWAARLIEWGVLPDPKAMKLWASSGYGLASNTEDKKERKTWPDKEIAPYKKDIISSIYALGDESATDIVNNNHITAFLFTIKLLANNKSKKNQFLSSVADQCFSNPKSEVASYIVEKAPKLLQNTFKVDESWIKKLVNRRLATTKLESFMLTNKDSQIHEHALSLSDLHNEKCPKLIIAGLKSLPKHVATLVLRAKCKELGVEELVPHISRKDHLIMLLSDENDPYTLMLFATKPQHQAYLMERIAEL